MADVSTVIPFAPYHEAIVERAMASCFAQTVPCDIVLVRDYDKRGSGYARNQGLARVTTPFVSFLDADDTIAPNFVERCLSVIKPNRYSYTDWFEGSEYRTAPDLAWVNRQWHCITTLLHTDDVLRVGGFDEDLPAGEDTDLYVKLTRRGICGICIHEPLFVYGKEGQRAKAFVNSDAYERVMATLNERYGDLPMPCTDCGDFPPTDQLPPSNEPQPGDVLAQALWEGNRIVRGRATGRAYPRSGWGRKLYAHPDDIDAAPNMFRRVDYPAPPPMRIDPTADVRLMQADQRRKPYPDGGQTYKPILEGAADVGNFLFPPSSSAVPVLMPTLPVQAAPDVSKASMLYQKALNPDMPLSSEELAGVIAGDTLEVTPTQTKINRKRRTDKVTSGQRARRRA